MAHFIPSEVEILVDTVSNYPVLYNVSATGYKDVVLREKIWREIGEKLKKPSGDCKKRWKTIRDSYFRCKNKVKKRKSLTGSRLTKWHLYERLSFLNIVVKEQNTDTPTQLIDNSTMKCDNLEHKPNIEECTPNITIHTEETKPIRSTRKKFKNKSLHTKISDELVNHKSDRLLKHRKDVGGSTNYNCPIESFSEHVKTTLKGLPHKLMIQAKIEIFNVLTKFEIQAAEITS